LTQRAIHKQQQQRQHYSSSRPVTAQQQQVPQATHTCRTVQQHTGAPLASLRALTEAQQVPTGALQEQMAMAQLTVDLRGRMVAPRMAQLRGLGLLLLSS
jgi:hypothetical protein